MAFLLCFLTSSILLKKLACRHPPSLTIRWYSQDTSLPSRMPQFYKSSPVSCLNTLFPDYWLSCVWRADWSLDSATRPLVCPMAWSPFLSFLLTSSTDTDRVCESKLPRRKHLMILNVIKWCTVQRSSLALVRAQVMWLKNGCHLLSHSFSPLEYRWRRKEILPIRALWNGRALQYLINSLTLGKIILHLSLFSFKKTNKKKRVKLNFTSVWESNPQDQDSNPAKPHAFPRGSQT